MPIFEIFTQLPLFKGVDKDELFSLIPKINLDFENYQPGDVIFDRQMHSHGLVYLLNGKVEAHFMNGERKISSPDLLSYTGLFGSNRHYSMDVTAVEKSSILNIETKSLLFLFRHCPVFLMNYLDLLSNTIEKLSIEREIEF
ncbi:MAG: cyclic nucleotide-binding domain-containing protein [Bacteroidales bacterium]|nr:cyclic nucleotide-binding domain-containing protein [Bacteroidales bacterium]